MPTIPKSAWNLKLDKCTLHPSWCLSAWGFNCKIQKPKSITFTLPAVLKGETRSLGRCALSVHTWFHLWQVFAKGRLPFEKWHGQIDLATAMFHHLMFPDSCVQSLHCQMPIRNEYIYTYICHDMAFARAFTFALGLGLGMAFALAMKVPQPFLKSLKHLPRAPHSSKHWPLLEGLSLALHWIGSALILRTCCLRRAWERATNDLNLKQRFHRDKRLATGNVKVA